jgi:selenide,water dikinase
VYRLTDDIAVVQTVDFFTPIVDDPYAFGQIAAANALSDVYAMGGRPLSVLNIVGFPVTKLPHEVLARILEGGADKVHEAGAVVLGGHSIDDPEPKFGLAVMGVVHPNEIRTKAGVRPGDRLVLTKPIGLGVLTTAIKKGLTTPEDERTAVEVMARLNDIDAILRPFAIRGLTDVTGFGLLGHASEMARASGVGIRVHAREVPVLESAWTFARQGTWPGGTSKNRAWLEDKVTFAATVDDVTRNMLCDPVTSGGLLIAVAADRAEDLSAALRASGTISAALIAECTDASPGMIEVEA